MYKNLFSEVSLNLSDLKLSLLVDWIVLTAKWDFLSLYGSRGDP